MFVCASNGAQTFGAIKSKAPSRLIDSVLCFVLEAGLEPAQPQWPKDFKSFVSTIPPFEQPWMVKTATKIADCFGLRKYRDVFRFDFSAK